MDGACVIGSEALLFLGKAITSRILSFQQATLRNGQDRVPNRHVVGNHNQVLQARNQIVRLHLLI